MYGTHVILVDALTAEKHDALVVGSQAAFHGGPEELLNLGYVRKDGPKHAMHEHRILYRSAVRPKSHLDVEQGKVTHWYEVPNEAVAGTVGNDALEYTLYLDGDQRGYPAPANETIAILDDEGHLHDRALQLIKENDVLAIGPYPQGSTVTAVEEVDLVVMIMARSNPPKPLTMPPIAASQQGPGDPAAANSAATAIDGVNNFPPAAADQHDETVEEEVVAQQ